MSIMILHDLRRFGGRTLDDRTLIHHVALGENAIGAEPVEECPRPERHRHQ